MVELVCGLHHVSFGGDKGMFQSSEASDGASLPKMQEDEIHEGISPWESQGV